MKKITQLNLGNWFKLPNPGLRAYLSHTVNGSDEIVRCPFWDGEDPAKVVDRWSDLLQSYRVDSKMPGLEAFELEMRGKIGPLSVQLPLNQRLESIEQYYTAVAKPSNPIDERAVRSFLRTLVPVRGIRLRSQQSTVEQMRVSTNSGDPYFTKRRNVIGKTIPFQLVSGTKIVYPGGYSYLITSVLGWRGQEGGPEPEDVRQRVIFMFPFAVNIEELRFYQPAISAWQRHSINSAYISMRAVEEKITKLFDTKGDEYCIVTDFSKFDQHFNSSLQDAARTCIMYMMGTMRANDDESMQWLNDIYPIKFRIPLLCSEDLMYEGEHGMGSGSGGTNFDECCAHSCMQHEAAILNGATLNPYSNAYGDDGYLSFKGADVDKVISAYSSHGQEMNPSKQSVDKHSAVYLRRYFHDSYRDNSGIMLGVYSTFRALGRLLYQERFYDPEIWSGEMVTLRALSILENCANSPVFTQFVNFVMKGDKYRLGLAIPGFLDSLPSRVKKANEMIPDFLGYTKTLQGDGASGIENWRVVKYLKSLS